MTTQLQRIFKKPRSAFLADYYGYVLNTHIALSVKYDAVSTLADDQMLVHPEGGNLRVSAAELRLTHIKAIYK